MIFLHAAVVGESLCLWAEAPVEDGSSTARSGLSSSRAKRRRGAARRPAAGATAPPDGPAAEAPAWPFDAGAERLAAALAAVPGGFLPDAERRTSWTAWLPVRAGQPVPSSRLLGDPPDAAAPAELAPWRVTAVELDREEALTLLSSVVDRRTLAPGVAAAPDLTFWTRALRFTGELVLRQRFLPGLLASGDAGSEASPPGAGRRRGRRARNVAYRACWEPVIAGPDLEALAWLARAMPRAAVAVVPNEADGELADRGPVAELRAFVTAMTDHIVRSAQWEHGILPFPVDGDGRARSVASSPLHSVHDQWLAALLAPDPALDGDPDELDALSQRIAAWRRPLAAAALAPFRLCFRLEEPKEESDAEPVDGPAGALAEQPAEATAGPPTAGPASRAGRGAGIAAAPDGGGIGRGAGTATIARDAARAGQSNGGNGAGNEPGPQPAAGHAEGEDATPLTAAAPPRSPWRLRFLLQAADDPSLILPLERVWHPDPEVAEAFRRRRARPRAYLLEALGRASRISTAVEAALADAQPAGADLDATAAYRFLREEAPILEEAGFGVFLPSWWTRRGARQRPRLSATIRSPDMAASSGELSLDSLVQVQWELVLGGQRLTREELDALVALKAPLIRVRGQWVEVDAAALAGALDRWTRRREGTMPARDAVRLALGAAVGPDGQAPEHVQATGWVGDLVHALADAGGFQELEPPGGLAAELRPYQRRGFSWLHFLARWGLGACLADDMGLGKTVQALALVARHREASNAGAGADDTVSRGNGDSGAGDTGSRGNGGGGNGDTGGGPGPVLVVCPTSVAANWRKEAERFTPDLPVLVHHGPQRARGDRLRAAAAAHAIVVTTYPLLQRDVEDLAAVQWRGVILDEAQNIKNPDAKQARAARALRAGYRIALTGTPVENHVGDLWSLMEFLNPGLLGGRSDFKRRYFLPIQTARDPEAVERLRRVTGPFILRRVKTDRSVIRDLPDKLEMKVWCTLTPEQASLYAAALRELEDALDGGAAHDAGIERSGLILATLTRLKQACNHPAQLLGDGSAIAGRSGKLDRLVGMLDEVLETGERALVFTQFAEMGTILRNHLQETFAREVLFLHGGVPKARRDEMVSRFQGDDAGPEIFVLSLRAGGTGLNLTRANHVFHFDRWWNPAVENQATDRAFRIGQTRDVQVHKFLCAGTLEERIDAIIEGKSALAGQIVGTGEAWLTKLSNAELRDLLALREEDAIGE